MTSRGDTIAAVATAPGRAGVAVVRVSGSRAFAIARAIAGVDPEPGRILFSEFRAPPPAPPALLDSGILLSFSSPRSYTGEDVVEFQTHGGDVAPRRVLEAAISAGARLARRGEFTERAFLNGKLSLDEAESVLDLIDAKTDRAADAALAGLSGERLREARRVYDAIVSLSSTVEHALDVDEEDLPDGFCRGTASRFADISSRLDGAIARMRERAVLRDGALVVIAGEPNAGKSSLFNVLAGESRAIVSGIPGTTRDSVETWLDMGGFPVRLVDTAGIRETSDPVEAEGVRRANSLAGNADLVILLDPSAAPSGKILPVLPKADLCDKSGGPPPGLLAVSAKTGAGVDLLRSEIVRRLKSLPRIGEADSAAKRLLAAYLSVRTELDGASKELGGGGESPDLVLFGNALRRAAEPLGGFLGATYTEDLLDAVFSRFCVGK